MTPHIECDKDLIAPLVIMPGDPRRAKYIAEKFLTNYKLVNSVRNEYAYTGYFNGVKVTIFSSGMGNASMGIYSHELFNFYDVKAILRVGSCGSYSSDVKVHEVLLIDNVYSNSNYALEYLNEDIHLVKSNEIFNKVINDTAIDLNINLKKVNCNNVDAFYNMCNIDEMDKKYGCKIVEMESFALFVNAKKCKKLASALVTVSDSLVTGEKLSSNEREKDFDEMIKLALTSIIKI